MIHWSFRKFKISSRPSVDDFVKQSLSSSVNYSCFKPINFATRQTELQSFKLNEITKLEKQCANRKGPDNQRVSDPGEFKLGCQILQDGRIIAD